MTQKKLLAGVIISSIFFMGGCAGKKDFTKGVSEEDKKLISSGDDEILYTFSTHNRGKPRIRITKNGFYPDYNLKTPVSPSIHPSHRSDREEFDYNYYSSYPSNLEHAFGQKTFNLKKFIDDINKYKLKELRKNILFIKSEFPEFNAEVVSFRLKDFNTLASKDISFDDKVNLMLERCDSCIKSMILADESLQKRLFTKIPHMIKHYPKVSKDMKKYAYSQSRVLKRECVNRKSDKAGWYWQYNRCFEKDIYQEPRGIYKESSYRGGSSSSGGGYSDSSSSRSNNSNYVPGRGYYRPGQGHGHSSQY